MVRRKIQSITRFDLFSTHLIPATIVFIMMMVVIGFSWRTAARTISDTRNEEVEERATIVETNIRERMALYETTLRAASGLFESSTFVDRAEWKNFVEGLDYESQLPGVLGIGYVELTSASELTAFTNAMIADGFPNFKISPAPEPSQQQLAIVKYIEPMNERNLSVIGGNMNSEANRRAALERARDTGSGSMTDVVPVLQDATTRKNGVVLYHPVYRRGIASDTVEQRREAILGYVYAPLSADNLFGKLFTDRDENFNFEITDTDNRSSDGILYKQYTDQDDSSYYWISERSIRISDQEWIIRYGVRDGIVAPSIRSRPQNVAFGGTVFSLIVAAIVYLLLQRRTRVISDKQERKIERAKDNLLSLASHQLRTPATGVKQYLGMVLEGFTGALKPEQRDVLSRAYESNERQLRIINEFLYLARADANRVVISPQRFDLLQLTKQIIEDMQTDILEAGHTIQLKHKAKKLDTFADVHSARMIIENLVSNAIKYTPSGGRIVVTLKRNGNYNAVEVEDNGVGIESKDFPKLFKQFSRIPNELTRQTTGTGIGLYLSHFLAKTNGGGIVVYSEKGRGSAFTLQLPRKSVKKSTVQKNN